MRPFSLPPPPPVLTPSCSLRGCYIYSGGLCSTVMGPNSNSGWDPADNAQRFPRIYSATDGLRTTDEDEDCTFVVWKKKAEQLRLDKSGNLRVFRARSKVSFLLGSSEGGGELMGMRVD